MPYHRFLQSFCESAEELELHRTCRIESAKEAFGRCFPLTFQAKGVCYRSPVLQGLRDKNDRDNGVPVRLLSKHYDREESAWRRHIDPAIRRQVQASIKDKQAADALWDDMKDEERKLFALETSRCRTDLVEDFGFDEDGRYRFLAALLERELAPLGFQYAASRSSSRYPLYAKPVSADWDLCWALEDQKSFLLWLKVEPSLQLRSRKLRGKVEKYKIDEYLFVDYALTILNFGQAYWKYTSLSGIETIIKAYACLYSLMAPRIEQAIHSVLGEALSQGS